MYCSFYPKLISAFSSVKRLKNKKQTSNDSLSNEHIY